MSCLKVICWVLIFIFELQQYFVKESFVDVMHILYINFHEVFLDGHSTKCPWIRTTKCSCKLRRKIFVFIIKHWWYWRSYEISDIFIVGFFPTEQKNKWAIWKTLCCSWFAKVSGVSGTEIRNVSEFQFSVTRADNVISQSARLFTSMGRTNQTA